MSDVLPHLLRLRPFLLKPLVGQDHCLTPHGRDARRVLLQLAPDFWTLLHRFRDQVDQPVCLDGSSGDEETTQQSVVFSLSVAVLICLSADVSFFMPAVHSHMFVMQQVMPLVTALFERSEPEATHKALCLLNHLLRNVGQGALPAAFCDIISRYPVHRSLVRVMRYSGDASCRTDAVNAFKRLVCAFDPAGRVKVVTVLLSDPTQVPGVIELLLLQYLHFVTSDATGVYADRRNLKAIITAGIIACFRNAGASPPSDGLLQNSESILALLSLIRFLLLSHSHKEAGVRDMAPMIRDRLIAPLKQELASNKDKLEQELSNLMKLDSRSKVEAVDHLKNMQIQIKNDDANADANVTDDCPDDFQEQGARTALIKLDMIESVVDRVQELIG